MRAPFHRCRSDLHGNIYSPLPAIKQSIYMWWRGNILIFQENMMRWLNHRRRMDDTFIILTFDCVRCFKYFEIIFDRLKLIWYRKNKTWLSVVLLDNKSLKCGCPTTFECRVSFRQVRTSGNSGKYLNSISISIQSPSSSPCMTDELTGQRTLVAKMGLKIPNLQYNFLIFKIPFWFSFQFFLNEIWSCVIV